jgi:hypothetical protein
MAAVRSDDAPVFEEARFCCWVLEEILWADSDLWV